jgi:hypothetical protein
MTLYKEDWGNIRTMFETPEVHDETIHNTY